MKQHLVLLWNRVRRFLGFPPPERRYRTCDAISPAVVLAEQELDWLRRSCLKPADLPGRLQPGKMARTIEFYDIDGKRVPEADIVRRFRSASGFGANIEPEPKYVHAPGVRPHLYFPRNGSNHWRKWAEDAKKPKLFAEGCAKAASANKFGFPAVGIQGCWGWRSVKHGLLMLPEFNDFALEDCDVYWIPDRDRKPGAVADILRASNAFALLLKERGARVHVCWFDLIEGFDKVGLDDFLFHYSRAGQDMKAGKNALAELLAATPLWEDFEITEPGNARRWVSMFGPRFRHTGHRGWLVYAGGCWRDDSRLEHQETTKQMFEGLLEDARNAGNAERFGLLSKHVTAQRIDNVPRLAKSDPAIVVTSDQLDRHPLLVNAKNGTLEMPVDKSGKLRFRPHSPDDLLTRSVSVDWNPKAECPQFEKALRVWTDGDADLARTVTQLLGLSLTGVTREQVFIILYGPSATGKSTLIEIVREILANYAVTLSSDTFLVRRNGLPEERKVAPLVGARFASSSETEQGGVMDENLIKQLSGEDSIAARRLYEEQFNYVPEAKIWLRTNNRPEIRGTDEAIWRRVVVLPFGHEIPPKQRDRFLREKLRRELEGILALMVQGYVDYVENGLVLAPIVLKSIEEYRKEQDVLERFFEAECDFAPEYSVGREMLYLAFESWCEDNHVRVVPPIKQFKAAIVARYPDRLREKQVTVGPKKQEWRWLGVDTKRRLAASAAKF